MNQNKIWKISPSYYIEENKTTVVFGYRCDSLLTIINNVEEVLDRTRGYCKRNDMELSYFIFVPDCLYDEYVMEVTVKNGKSSEKKRY